MFVFIVIAVTSTVASGTCPEGSKFGVVDCSSERLTAIPQPLPENAVIL